MGLKINKVIGTNRGITSESYVRIERYDINKHVGNISIDIGLYQNKDIAQSASLYEYKNPYFGLQYPDSQYISNNVDVSIRYIFPVTSSLLVSGSNVDIIDMSPLQSQSIFEFAYPRLKTELETVFGVGTIEDDL
jgi:hypothetical protein